MFFCWQKIKRGSNLNYCLDFKIWRWKCFQKANQYSCSPRIQMIGISFLLRSFTCRLKTTHAWEIIIIIIIIFWKQLQFPKEMSWSALIMGYVPRTGFTNCVCKVPALTQGTPHHTSWQRDCECMTKDLPNWLKIPCTITGESNQNLAYPKMRNTRAA